MSTVRIALLIVPALGAALLLGSASATRIAVPASTAIGGLRSLATSQARFQAGAAVDQDGDGVGEFGFLQEVGGIVAPRGRDRVGEAIGIESLLGRLAQDGGGVAGRSGYHFIVYLPDGQGGWLAETTPLPAADPAAADAQEQRFVAYAWPTEFRRSSNCVLVVDPWGEVLASKNLGAQGYVGRDGAPPPEAAYSRDPDSGELVLVHGATGGDGCEWVLVGNGDPFWPFQSPRWWHAWPLLLPPLGCALFVAVGVAALRRLRARRRARARERRQAWHEDWLREHRSDGA